MKILNNKLKSDLNIRTEKNFPIDGIEFIDITPLFIDKNSFNEICDLFEKELKNKKIDYIIGPEARGFLLASVLADRLGVGLIPIRKKGKLPPTSIIDTISYMKEYGIDYLEIPKLVNSTYKNKRIYIIEDIYATGNTVKAIHDGITKCIFNNTI